MQTELLNSIRANGFTAQDKLAGLLYSGVSEVLEIIQAIEVVNVTDIVDHCYDIPQSVVSQHLRKLRRAGLVESQRIGLFKFYNIVPGGIERINRICGELAEGYRAELVEIEAVESN